MKKNRITFTKMAGAGNDFVIIEAKKGLNVKSFAQKICDRTNGIGADGLLVLDKSKKTDYRMHIINADGSRAEMCGNGVRCIAAYIVDQHNPKKSLFGIETLAGTILAEASKEIANVRLSDPLDYQPKISLTLSGKKINISSIDTGVPHAIIYVDSLANIDVTTIGRVIRHHRKFQPRGTNVNFAEQINQNLVATRTYERGVEDETKACGTGSVAVAIVTYLKANSAVTNKSQAKMKVQTKGGEILEVKFDLLDGQVSNVWLKGSAKFIAQGEYYV